MIRNWSTTLKESAIQLEYELADSSFCACMPTQKIRNQKEVPVKTPKIETPNREKTEQRKAEKFKPLKIKTEKNQNVEKSKCCNLKPAESVNAYMSDRPFFGRSVMYQVSLHVFVPFHLICILADDTEL